MILLDWRGFVIPQMYGYKRFVNSAKFEVHDFEQIVLRNLGLLNLKHKNKYGELVICCDCRKSRYWRTEIFPEYKGNRKSKQLDNTFTDPEMVKTMGLFPVVFAEKLKDNFQFKVLTVDRAEADDIIGTLVYSNPRDKHLIVSGDGDFIQLQNFNVDQFSTKGLSGKWLKSNDPTRDLREKILAGDSKDGIPNVLSDPDTLVTEGKTQTALRAPQKKLFMDMIELPSSVQKRFDLNEQLIDLSKTPGDIAGAINEEYDTVEVSKKSPMTAILNLGYGDLIDSPDLFTPNI